MQLPYSTSALIKSAIIIVDSNLDINNDITMSQKKLDQNNLTPPSQMIRVPTALVPLVRELSRLHRQGQTTPVLQGLQNLISTIDSNSDIDIAAGSKSLLRLEIRLDELESRLNVRSDWDTKLEAVTKKLEQLEGAVKSGNNARPRKSASPYQFQHQQVELQPFPLQNLSQRLGVTPSTLTAEQEKLTPKEFISWTRHRDPRSMGWQFIESDGLYHPVPQ